MRFTMSSRHYTFLYAPEVSGTATYGACKQILRVIGDHDDNIRYGYAGRPDCAMFRDFRRLLQDCADNKTKLRWN